MDKYEYAKIALDSAFKYEKDVLSNKIIVNKFIKKAVKRQIKLRKKYYYNEDAILDVFQFMYFINLSNNGITGRMEIMPWQAWLLLSIYSIYRDKDFKKRLVREVLIYISRKQGKSTLSAILGLYELIKGERHPEIYVVSSTRDQASQLFDYWTQIISDSPALKKRVKKRQYDIQTVLNGIGKAKAEVNEPERLNGKNVSLGIVDESAILPTKELYQVLLTGTVKRVNPLMIQISTASAFKEYYFYNDIEIGKKVLNGNIDSDNTFYALYTLDDKKEMDNPNMWIKSMPALDVLVSKEDMIIAYDKACLTTSDKIDFNIKHFNIYEDNETNWIPDNAYLKCFKDVNFKVLKVEKSSLKVYLGLDLSSTRDLASLVAVFENPITNKIEVMPEFYFPTTDNEANKIRKSGIDLSGWIEKGFIVEHKNKIIDYNMIFDRIEYYVDNFDVQGISYDAWSAKILMSELESKLAIDLYAAPQNTTYFNFPLKYIERLVYSEMINLTKNPVLRWHFSNVVLYRDGNGNIKVMKNKSRESVDGVVSLAMAIGLYAKLNFDAVSMVMDGHSGTGLQIDKKVNRLW